jgi:DNA-binding HxlR family transcriptional regulator
MTTPEMTRPGPPDEPEAGPEPRPDARPEGRPKGRPDGRPERVLSLGRIVGAAIRIADADGLEALSMRRVASALGAGTMSLYRYLPSKDELVGHMVDAVFGEIDYPRPAPAGWRARLELSARQEWEMYRRHLWVLPIVAMTQRPPLGPNVLASVEWSLGAVDGLGLDPTTMLRVYLTVSDYVQGSALYFAHEASAERHSGITTEQWWAQRSPAMSELLASGRYPLLSRVIEAGDVDMRAAAAGLFEFGLQRLLDGLAAYIPEGSPPAAPRGTAVRIASQPSPSTTWLSEVTNHASGDAHGAARSRRLPAATAAAMELLTRRWVPEVLYVLRQGEARFGELAEAIPGVSRRILTERLRLLAGVGLVRRNVDSGPPTRITYALTVQGADLAGALEYLDAWASDTSRVPASWPPARP